MAGRMPALIGIALGLFASAHSMHPTQGRKARPLKANLDLDKTLEQVIHTGSLPYRFVVRDGAEGQPDLVEVWYQGRLLQVLSPNYLEGAIKFTFVDFNFDGYLDLAIPSWKGATGNEGFEIFLFNPRRGRFEHSKRLSLLCCPEVDPKTRTVTYHSNGGMAGGVHDQGTCVWGGDQLIEVSRESQDFDSKTKKFIRTEWKSRGGRLVKVKRESIDPDS